MDNTADIKVIIFDKSAVEILKITTAELLNGELDEVI